ncbi:MAG TPA: LysM peptidoglycan-binding domain-containing protein, partial [Victivallales bacterium]|nr:LysM peptidoglycan-binding domain-containing protein [Victivallales bacterium]
MKTIPELISGKSIVVAGTVSILFFAGCSTEKVLTERPYIPAPSDQIPSSTVAPLPTIPELNIPPTPELPPFQEPKVENITYKVQKGDSLWKIARMYGVSMQELASFNNMDLKSILKVGTTLRIPPGGALLPPEKLNSKIATKEAKQDTKKVSQEALPADGVYVVKSGDSLWKIAKKFNTTVDKIVSANNIDPKSPLQVGQKIRVSGSAHAPVTEISKETKTENVFSEPPPKLDIPVDENQKMPGLDEIINEEDMKTLEKETTPIEL